MIKAIIFDADGTIYDETNAKAKSELMTAAYISQKTGIAVDDIYHTFRSMKKRITSTYGSAPERNDRCTWYRETLNNLHVKTVTDREASEYYWNVFYDSIELFFDLKFILPRLYETYRLYILTDELLTIQQKKIHILGVERYFQNIISSEQAGYTKPSKVLFDYALNVIGESPETVIMVGDNPAADIKGGKLAGLHTAWFQRGKYHYYPCDDSMTADIVFQNYVQLPGK
ncbi:MAG: HAD family hydrolase [Clostridia bacterium]|nr:HAD family hydrolase [Clostridia bacterium]